MPYTINLPQGKTARLDKIKDANLIKSIFTTNLATCNAVIFATKDKLSFTHADFRTTEAELLAEQEWAGKDCEIYIIHHGPHEEWKDHNKDRFTQCLPNAKTVLIHDDMTGVEATFKTEESAPSKENTLPAWITPLPRGTLPSEKLAYHPNQHQFEAGHMIEEHFRKDAIEYYAKNPRKTNIIFDNGWSDINPAEFTPQIGNASILLSKPGAKYFKNISQIAHEDIGFTAHFSLYTNNYDIYNIFFNEVVSLLSNITSKTPTDASATPLIDLIKLYYHGDKKAYYAEFTKLFEKYRENNPNTEFSNAFIPRVNAILLYFNLQEKFLINVSVCNNFQNEISRLKNGADKAKSERNFDAAINLYRDCINLAKLTYLASHLEHANLNFMLASVYFSKEDYASAKIYLDSAKLHYQKYNSKMLAFKNKLNALDNLLNHLRVNTTAPQAPAPSP